MPKSVRQHVVVQLGRPIAIARHSEVVKGDAPPARFYLLFNSGPAKRKATAKSISSS